jgi:hypothetical protein
MSFQATNLRSIDDGSAMTDETRTITLRRTGQVEPVTVTARRTENGNLRFTYAGMRHVLTQDGLVLQMIRYARANPSWEPSPILAAHKIPAKP